MPYADRKRRAVYMRDVFFAKPRKREEHRARVKKWKVEAKEKKNALLKAFRSGGCVLCGESDPACLDAHHVNPSSKQFTIGAMASESFGPERIARELRKCACLCANCHRKVHAGRITVDLQPHAGAGVPDVPRARRGKKVAAA